MAVDVTNRKTESLCLEIPNPKKRKKKRKAKRPGNIYDNGYGYHQRQMESKLAKIKSFEPRQIYSDRTSPEGTGLLLPKDEL